MGTADRESEALFFIGEIAGWDRKQREGQTESKMDRYEFEILSMLARERPKQYSQRELSCAICISASAVADSLQNLERKSLIRRDGPYAEINERGIEALEPHRVKRAVILAAGFGSRMMPATKDRPKPMVRVHGKRIIDTLLDALIAAGVTDITVVGGYRFDKLTELRENIPIFI